ncbi:serine/threonine-protein kinase [Aggregatilinea lenta]|uniref:serine/threonine-protein kinase n=1 Tax=Aggregatilinea lenta TaxID=913108 RepID=UPI000E5A5539|nr:serine/threonine-protein kinase [Aggregatilinea lenta]
MDDTLIGAVIGGYKILEEVGRGGMATVYRAHQLSVDRDVAIKMLPPQFLTQTVSLERFQREANIIARLEHRAIVPVHDYGEYDGIPYIVMRYMDSGSVEELLVDGPVDPQHALIILEQIGPALDYAHREGVLHRDLKPSNILLDANGDAYITDFGIARILGPEPKPLTTSGVVGTPSYMSPEQAQGHDLDGRSDLYGLAVVLFEMLTGVRPFDGETPYSVAVKHVTEPVPSACRINPALPPAVEEVLYRALAKSRDERYQTAVALAAALKTALDHPLPEPVGASQAAVNSDTEPSPNEALRAVLAQGPVPQSLDATSPSPPPFPPITTMRPASEGVPAVPPYQPPLRSRAIPPVNVRRRKSGAPSWLTWAAITLLLGGMLLAAALGGAYFLLNASDTPEPGSSASYRATAEVMLTATKQAVLDAAGPTATVDPELSATPPPTLTPRGETEAAPQTTPTASVSLP